MRVYRRNNDNARKTAASLAVFFSIVIIPIIPVHGQNLEFLDHEIPRIVERISGLVVTVESRLQASRAPLYPGTAQKLAEPVNAVVGSGLMIDSAGHILTVLSLVDGYDDFRIQYDNQNVPARLIGVDRGFHLAVLKIDGPVAAYLEPSPFPPFSGRLVLSYGRASGGTGYPSLGIIAGRQSDGSYLVSGSAVPGVMGGGVFDLAGRLAGIIAAGNIPSDGAGYRDGIVMIPVGTALSVADRIICCGDREAGYLGVTTTAIELVSGGKKVLGEAVVISEVEPNSPAAVAGLRPGDIITRVSYREITSDRQLQRLISSAGSDSTIIVDVMRGGTNFTLNIGLKPLSQARRTVAYTPSQNEINARLIADLQRRIDEMRTEMERLQRELNRLLGQSGSAR
jgi:S1-C subfamily serine protease